MMSKTYLTRYRLEWLTAACVLSGLLLVARSAAVHSPNLDEVGHLPAGIAVVTYGNFELYEVNPPLVKSIAAVPLLFVDYNTDWTGFSDAPGARTEWRVGSRFIAANGERSVWLFTIARWALLPIWLIGTAVIWKWSRELAGPAGALAAVVSWCYCPEVITWSATICPDSAAASMGVLCMWTFRGWVRDQCWPRAVLAGTTFGLALLTKTTWLVLVPVLPCLGLWYGRHNFKQTVAHQLLIALAALYTLNSGYAFSRSFMPLGDYKFFSATLGGRKDDGELRQKTPEEAGNRFSDSWIGQIPVPLPGSFIEGLDLQKYDFEEGKWSYLRGEHRFGGWWYWYLYALLVKTPVGLLVLIPAAALLTLAGKRNTCFGDQDPGVSKGPGTEDNQGDSDSLTAHEALHTAGNGTREMSRAEGGQRLSWPGELVLLLLPAVIVFTLVSSQTGFSRYLRYVLPCYPFVFVWLSLLFSPAHNPWPWLRKASWGMLTWMVISSLSVFPHSMAYFNEFAGGPNNGPAHLIDASIDWGQDVLLLSDWCRSNNVGTEDSAEPLYLSLHSFFDPRVTGINYLHPPVDHRYAATKEWVTGDKTGPLPGWYAISVHQLYGRNRKFAYLFDFEPETSVAYSIYIYHLSEDQVNQWRQQNGLPAAK